MSEKQVTHTQGPWTTSRSTHGTWIESKSIDSDWSKEKDGNYAGRWAGHVVSLPDHMEQDGVQCGSIAGQDKTQGEIDANARLIAAAPELFEQCKLFEQLLTESDLSSTHEGLSNCDKLANLRAILDRVEGETT